MLPAALVANELPDVFVRREEPDLEHEPNKQCPKHKSSYGHVFEHSVPILLILMTGGQIFFIVAGWTIGFVSAVASSWFLERRRAFRSILSACHAVEFRLTDDAAFPQFHRWSLSILEAPFFHGVGFLWPDAQKQAYNAWTSYQGFDPTLYPEAEFLGIMSVELGLSPMTRVDAMRIEIQKLRTVFERFP